MTNQNFCSGYVDKICQLIGWCQSQSIQSRDLICCLVPTAFCVLSCLFLGKLSYGNGFLQNDIRCGIKRTELHLFQSSTYSTDLLKIVLRDAQKVLLLWINKKAGWFVRLCLFTFEIETLKPFILKAFCVLLGSEWILTKTLKPNSWFLKIRFKTYPALNLFFDLLGDRAWFTC